MSEPDLVFLQNCSESDSFFFKVCIRDEAERRAALANIVSTIRNWVQNKSSEEYLNLLKLYIGGLVRMAYQNPFEDIRLTFLDILEELRVLSILVPEYYDPNGSVPSDYAPSVFIPPCELPLLTKDEDTSRMLQELFLARGRISHLNRVMSYYSTYMGKFEAVYELMMNGGGPLPKPWRHYLAILGASRHNCRYLVVNQEVEFFQSGGDRVWLEGIDKAPVKIQNLARLNALLAHQPWLITPQHIQELTSGESNWNLPELVQAITILSTFHCLAGFAWGLGISIEVDRRGEYGSNLLSIPATPEESEFKDVESTQEIILQSTSELVNKLKEFNDEEQPVSKHFEEGENDWKPQNPKRISRSYPKSFSRYHGVEMIHEDFNVKAPHYKMFQLQDCCWQDHGFTLLSRYDTETGELLDNVFTEVLNLTEHSFSDSQDVDTWPFRQAIWYYTFRLKGMSHDDYNYSKVNACLNINLKKYIKKVACDPESITRADYANMGLALKNFEKAHINYLILEARRQSELVYFLNAILKSRGV